jgi:UMF1 family MFS transporter
MTEAAALAARNRKPRAVIAWCFGDFGLSAFNTVIGTFVFSVYFARGIYGDKTQGSAVWGYALALAGFAVAVLCPIFGAIADRGGRRIPWLAASLALTILPTALLWYALPDKSYVPMALGLVVVASIGFELASLFYNALLPTVAAPERMGRISGWGWGLGYGGGLLCLGVCLVALIQPETPWFGIGKEQSANVRATSLVVALWLAVFLLPLFFFVREARVEAVPASRAVREGLASVVATVKRLPQQPNLLRYLIASALYRDGLNTLFAVGGLFAAGTFGMGLDQILIFALGLNVTAGLGAALFAWVDDGIGSRATILWAILGFIAFGVPIVFAESAATFIVLGLGLGLFVGPIQAASRTFMARLSPPDLTTEMFGLFALTGRSIAFLGPLMFATATDLFDSQRAGVATILLSLSVGGLLLFTVKDKGRAVRANEVK